MEGAKVVLRRVVPPFFSVLTTVMDSNVMTHVIKVVKEKKMEEACWKTDEDLLVRANVILLDKGPASSAKVLV